MVNGGLRLGGLTTPVTWAGNLSQMMAEAMAGLVLTQLIRPGVPVVINNSSSCADMRSLGLTVGAPESAINCIGTAQMSKFYGLPCRSGGAISDAKTVDAQAGAEGMMNLLTSAMTGTNYILHACGISQCGGAYRRRTSVDYRIQYLRSGPYGSVSQRIQSW